MGKLPSLVGGTTGSESPTNGSRGNRGWLRADRGLETYALKAPDSPKLAGLPRSPSSAGGARSRKLQRSDSTPAQRWWLREVAHGKSWCEGIYEIQTGMVQVHEQPSSFSPCLGALRAGTRFQGTPYSVSNCVWLRLRTEGRGVPKALFAIGTENREQPMEAESPSTRGARLLRTASDHGDMHRNLEHRDSVELLGPPLAGEAEKELWVQENLQYMKRVRDVVRGVQQWAGKPLGYSVCINHAKGARCITAPSAVGKEDSVSVRAFARGR